MAIPAERAERERGDESFEQRLARLRATPEERAQIIASASPFDDESWVRERGAASPEELVEMEEFLRERDRERERSLAREQGLGE
jgi:hypothetical protein